jgi:hypothetical protein
VTGCGSVTRAELGGWTKAELTIENHAQPGAAGRAALNLLIGWACLTAEAHRRHVVVSASEAVNQVDLSQETAKERTSIEWLPGERAIKPLLESTRISRADLTTLIKMTMTSVRLQSKEATSLEPSITPSAIVSYYSQHSSSFMTPERRDIRAIMNKSEPKDQEARREMESGVPFRQIEQRFNQTSEGGLQFGRGRGRQAAPWERDYFSAPAHVLIGPRKEIYYYVFEVLHIYRPHVRPLSEVEAKIRHLLALSQASSNAKAREAGLRGRVTCLSGYVGDRCGRYASSVAS